MLKYSPEFKLKAIEYYLKGNKSMRGVAKELGIPSHTPLKEWIKRYEEHGKEGLINRSKFFYSGEYKQYVVEYMHSNHLSATGTAVHFNLQTAAVLRWERIYYEEGPQGLYMKQRGNPKNINFKSERKLDKKIEEDLISENQRLRMENEYLKKLNALVQERIKRENEKK